MNDLGKNQTPSKENMSKKGIYLNKIKRRDIFK